MNENHLKIVRAARGRATAGSPSGTDADALAWETAWAAPTAAPPPSWAELPAVKAKTTAAASASSSRHFGE